MGLKDHQDQSRVGLVNHHLSEQRPLRYGWSPVGVKERGPALADPEPGRTQEFQAQSPDDKVALPFGGPILDRPQRLALPGDRTITIAVIKGASKGAAHRLTKARTSIGKIGGSADIQIEDPDASGLHCAVALTGDAVRLCDLDSAKGTFVDDKRIQATDLEHLSEFRIGSSLLLLTIVPKHTVDSA